MLVADLGEKVDPASLAVSYPYVSLSPLTNSSKERKAASAFPLEILPMAAPRNL